MIPPPGQKTFTSESSLRFAHELRRRADAILTGSGTVLADDPEFTVRRVPDHTVVAQGLKPRRLVVLDRGGRVPRGWLKRAEKLGFDVWLRGDAREALNELGSSGALEVLVEAGPSVSEFFLSQSLWDEHVLIRTPNLAAPESDRGDLQGDWIDVYRNHSKDRADHP
jgi:diaminohydroxyphosphoribosylaminopyrimidine deaminase/5-amino-6-(5-phosphoribosylamino)uracil reductase